MATDRHRLCRDPRTLLAVAPIAVDSFAPGHWELMCRLERCAREVVGRRDVEEAAAFFADVAYLKRPHRIDRETVRRVLLGYPREVLAAVGGLSRVRVLDYAVMDVLALVPWFGRFGGRSFNSAALRLVCPELFGIIDWRNVAVLCGSPGFDGLVTPPVVFSQFSREAVLVERGHLAFTSDVYRYYNDTLRSLAAGHGLRVADVDLVLWTYSIHRQPFPQYSTVLFTSSIAVGESARQALRRDHKPTAERMVQAYLKGLGEAGVLSPNEIIRELCSLFTLIRDECAAFGRGKKGKLRERIALILLALDEAIASRNPTRLLGQWHRWQGMVDPSSPQWIGISLPADMILEGYLVLEDFIPVKEFIESYYDVSTLVPRYAWD